MNTVQKARSRTVLSVLSAIVVVGLFSVFLMAPGSAHVNKKVGHVFGHIKNKMGYEVVTADFTVSAGGFLRDTADCPEGKEVLGGGMQVVGEGSSDFDTLIQESAPGTVGGGQTHLWLVSMQNTDNEEHDVAIFAVCANVR